MLSARLAHCATAFSVRATSVAGAVGDVTGAHAGSQFGGRGGAGVAGLRAVEAHVVAVEATIEGRVWTGAHVVSIGAPLEAIEFRAVFAARAPLLKAATARYTEIKRPGAQERVLSAGLHASRIARARTGGDAGSLFFETIADFGGTLGHALSFASEVVLRSGRSVVFLLGTSTARQDERGDKERSESF